MIAGSRVAASVMRYEPVGVVSAISAYNFPFWTSMWKAIPALLTGNSVILRPSPLTRCRRLSSGRRPKPPASRRGAHVVVESGVTGSQPMTTHQAVDMVTFTGSTAVGRQIMRQSADTVTARARAWRQVGAALPS